MSQTQTIQATMAISVLLNPSEAAARLRTTPGVLAVWRSAKRYPLRFVRVGRRIFYRSTDVEKFLELRTEPGVSEEIPSRTRRGRAARA